MTKKVVFSKPVKKQTMSEQMTETIKELIITGELGSGDVLPSEPDLCEQFGVSRAVVRDATRVLMALGLVEVKHGAGVFVTQSQSATFGEALLIALRRSGASAWDVEHFEQIMLPELIALAATTASDEELAEIRELVRIYQQVIIEIHSNRQESKTTPLAEEQVYAEAFQNIIEALYKSTHNHVFQQLARPLINLRNLRNWESDEGETTDNAVEIEMMYINGLVDAISSRDAKFARKRVQQLMSLPYEAIDAMKKTPIGEQPQIPLSLSELKDYLQNIQS
ncbi:MAG: FadR family transcriptional regulator [Anaerolineae bacterium]|nr:FadR family transcriptional regulator [Anaerolineae bacterium]